MTNGSKGTLLFPEPVIETHDNVVVVRDDLFPYGSKARFLAPYFASIREKEVVYGSSPRWGYAQISLAYLASKFGKRCTLFIPWSKEMSRYSRMAEELGAIVRQVPMGFLKVCEAHAQEHALNTGARLLPCGLDCPEALREIARIASRIPVKPDEVWTVASSGVLTRGLQRAFPGARFFAVQVGKELTEESAGRATILKAKEVFARPAKVRPPFASVSEYDAKCWRFIPKDGKKVRLFWNVGGLNDSQTGGRVLPAGRSAGTAERKEHRVGC